MNKWLTDKCFLTVLDTQPRHVFQQFIKNCWTLVTVFYIVYRSFIILCMCMNDDWLCTQWLNLNQFNRSLQYFHHHWIPHTVITSNQAVSKMCHRGQRIVRILRIGLPLSGLQLKPGMVQLDKKRVLWWVFCSMLGFNRHIIFWISIMLDIKHKHTNCCKISS